ncbi:hypothetical protein GOY07_00315 [Wolbachia endosymbiont of Litomosoides sigmodontis]|nr:hypothetical protein GOY07_00315 [Wolbachia endosymbiont of Litomosoides sigmodontis]
MYVTKKLNAVIVARQHIITTIAKICCISRTALTVQIKYLKFGREGKLFISSQHCEKTRLNQSKFK